SWYQLTIEPNTFFHHQPPTLPPDDTLWEIQEQCKLLLQQAGLQQYEVSAYAKSGHACQHNMNYWEFGDYLGIGAGAHSKISHFEKQIITRHSQVKNPRDYLSPQKTLTQTEIILPETELPFEFMLNGLRLIDGVASQLFIERTGLPLNALEPMLSFAQEKMLLIKDKNKLCATEMGQRFLNDAIGL